jgi:glutamate racemase
MGDGVTLVSSADETAKDVYRVLTRADVVRPDDAPPPVHRLMTTGDAAPFGRLAQRFLGADFLAGAPVATLSAGVAG